MNRSDPLTAVQSPNPAGSAFHGRRNRRDWQMSSLRWFDGSVLISTMAARGGGGSAGNSSAEMNKALGSLTTPSPSESIELQARGAKLNAQDLTRAETEAQSLPADPPLAQWDEVGFICFRNQSEALQGICHANFGRKGQSIALRQFVVDQDEIESVGISGQHMFGRLTGGDSDHFTPWRHFFNRQQQPISEQWMVVQQKEAKAVQRVRHAASKPQSYPKFSGSM